GGGAFDQQRSQCGLFRFGPYDPYGGPDAGACGRWDHFDDGLHFAAGGRLRSGKINRGGTSQGGISTRLGLRSRRRPGSTAARTRVQAAAVRGLTPLVGRRSEIEVFSRLVEKAASGTGQILAMVGEPGLGKSRLVHEFIRHQLRPGWLVLEGVSVSYGKATPYFPLIAMLRQYLQIADGERSENIREQVVMHILELDGMLKDAIPPILSLLGA